MKLTQVANEKPKDLVKKIEGYLLHGINGSEWDSNVVHLYVISNGNEGNYQKTTS
jgi:hypothetical protein